MAEEGVVRGEREPVVVVGIGVGVEDGREGTAGQDFTEIPSNQVICDVQGLQQWRRLGGRVCMGVLSLGQCDADGRGPLGVEVVGSNGSDVHVVAG